MENNQPVTDTPSAAPESSTPVESSPSPANAGTELSRQRDNPRTSRGRSSKKSSSGDRLTDSMTAAYDAIQARGDSGQQSPTVAPEQPNLAEIYGRRDAALDELAGKFETLPPETREYLRNAIDRPAMPQAWSQDKAELWGKHDPSVQAYIAQREQEAHQRITELGNQAKSSPIDEVVSRYQAHIPRGQDGQPMPAHSVLEHLLAAHSMLEQQPAAAIQALANSYGIDLRQMAHDPQAAAQQEQVRSHYEQTIAQLQHQNAMLQQRQQQWQSQRQEYLQKQALEYLQDKEYSPELEAEIHHQVAALRARDPAKFAIDPMAVLREAERRAFKFTGHGDKSSAAEAKKRADEAKRLASLNVKTTGLSRSPGNVSGDMWSPDAWDAAYAKASGR
jgi:hypothetical protein